MHFEEEVNGATTGTSCGNCNGLHDTFLVNQYKKEEGIRKAIAYSAIVGQGSSQQSKGLARGPKGVRLARSAFSIDRLCLDQNNEEEKCSQIPRMKEIYKQAFCVFADLGSAPEAFKM